MSDLRLFLLIIGIAVIAGIYFWGTFRAREQQRQQTVQRRSVSADVAEFKITSKTDTDIDYAAVLSGLNQSISQSRHSQTDSLSGPAGAEANARQKRPDTEKPDDEQASEYADGLFSGQSSATSSGSEQSRQPPGNSIQQIVTLHVIARGNEVFPGRSILNAVYQLDLQIGAMEIFHHYGIGEMKMEQALFSLANMIEPGSFDIKGIDKFVTPGLVMFMCLPSAIDGQVVFELMLNTAQRLAALLDGEVCDENRQLISEQKIDSIRNTIAG